MEHSKLSSRASGTSAVASRAKYVGIMGGSLYIRSQISAGIMPPHMQPALPQFACADVTNVAVLSDVNRLAILPAALGKFFLGKTLHETTIKIISTNQPMQDEIYLQ
jgi:hypothetical protein